MTHPSWFFHTIFLENDTIIKVYLFMTVCCVNEDFHFLCRSLSPAVPGLINFFLSVLAGSLLRWSGSVTGCPFRTGWGGMTQLEYSLNCLVRRVETVCRIISLYRGCYYENLMVFFHRCMLNNPPVTLLWKPTSCSLADVVLKTLPNFADWTAAVYLFRSQTLSALMLIVFLYYYTFCGPSKTALNKCLSFK